jgi:hypothetical protein
MCSWHSPFQKKEKGTDFFFQTPLLKKAWTIPHEECHFLLNMDYIVKEMTNLISNFTYRKQRFLSTE